MAEVLALQSEPYFKNWSIMALNGSTLDDKIRTARWTFFFLAGEIKATFFGAIGAVKIQRALQQIARKVKLQEFNCLEAGAFDSHSLPPIMWTDVSLPL